MDAGGTIIGASKIARDITARKLTEAALAKHAAEQTALYQFTDRLFCARSVNDVYEAALDAIIGALACDRASSRRQVHGLLRRPARLLRA